MIGRLPVQKSELAVCDEKPPFSVCTWCLGPLVLYGSAPGEWRVPRPWCDYSTPYLIQESSPAGGMMVLG